MHETPPDFETGTLEEWFRHFRWSSFIYSMPIKYSDALNEAPTADCARKIMTAYAACALDIALIVRSDIDHNVIDELKNEFQFSPQSFLYLNLRDIAALAGLDDMMVIGGFRLHGFTVGDDGQVTGFAAPSSGPKPPKPR